MLSSFYPIDLLSYFFNSTKHCQNMKFSIKVSCSADVTKSAISREFGHIYWRTF